MDDLIQLLRVTPAAEVAKKWNVTGQRLNEIVDMHKLPLYSIREMRIRPVDGKTVYFCQGPYFHLYREGPFGEEYYELEGIYFATDSIESYENEHPEILWAPANSDFMLEKEYGENIPADAIRKLLNMSPLQFIDFMNRGEGPMSSWDEDFRKHRGNLYSDGEFFSTSDLKNEGFTFHILDWKAWKEASDIEGKSRGIVAQHDSDNAEELHKFLQEKDAEILRLREDISADKARIKYLESQLEACAEARLPKTAPASAAKQENALAAWKPAIPAMLEVYHQCLAEGPTQRTKKDLERLFTRQGVELTQAQMTFFRDCLPEGHVNKTGGATVQKA